jgi:hypothetical protein
MEDVSIFYVHLVNFPVIWHILWPFGTYIFHRFGTFLPVLVFSSKKNLATLLRCENAARKKSQIFSTLKITTFYTL